jgi:glycosyltransferase involved in cell wall biosynthesis
MRVLHLSTFHRYGGAAVAAVRLHRALAQYGAATGAVESQMLIGAPTQQEKVRPEAGVNRLANTLLADGSAFGRFVAERLYFLPHERDKSVRFQFSPAAFGAGLAYHPLVQQADVLHLHWINFGFLSLGGLTELFRLGKPVVWTLHDQWAFTGGCHYARGCDRYLSHCQQCPYLRDPGERDLSYRIFEKKTALFRDAPVHLTPPSHWLAREAARSALLGHLPATVIPYAIDLETFRPASPAPEAGASILFGSASLTDPRKGFRYFAEALVLLKTRLPDSISPTILVFGKGTIYELGDLPFPVRYLGVLSSEEAVVQAYNLADVMVVPSLEDNLPNTVIESLACGTPVVAFATGGIPDMIDHRQNGYLADTGSAAQLADGLHWLLTHPDPESLRRAARQSAEARFAGPVVAERFVEVYELLKDRLTE